MPNINELRERLDQFTKARDWHRFHNPKNLAMALVAEAGELAAELQWVEGEASRSLHSKDRERYDRVVDEMADVFIYLTHLADAMNVDLVLAALAKVERNESRFAPRDPNDQALKP